MRVIDWIILDTRRKIAAEESGGKAADLSGSAAPPPNEPVSIAEVWPDRRQARRKANGRPGSSWRWRNGDHP
jgi:hypothetical protein